MLIISKVFSFLSLFTMVFMYLPQVTYAKEYSRYEALKVQPVIKFLNKEITRAERLSISMEEFMDEYALNFDENSKRIEKNLRLSIKKEKKSQLKRKMLALIKGSESEKFIYEELTTEGFDFEKNVLNVHFSKENQENIKQNELRRFNQYSSLADYLKDIRSQLLGEKIAKTELKLNRLPASDPTVGIFVSIILGLLIACLGGLLILFLPVAGLITVVVGTSLLMGGIVVAIVND